MSKSKILLLLGCVLLSSGAQAQTFNASNDPGSWAGPRYVRALMATNGANPQVAYDQAILKGYIRGFTDGINLYVPEAEGSVLKGADYEAVEAWLIQYGTENPMDLFLNAIKQAVEKQSPRLAAPRRGPFR